MKLVLAVVSNEDVAQLTDRLTEAGFGATRIASTGGFLRQGNTTFMVAVEDDQVERVIQIVRETCRRRTRYVHPLPPAGFGEEVSYSQPIAVEVGGAWVFVVPVERVEQV